MKKVLVVGAALATAGVALAGCSSTQDSSAQLAACREATAQADEVIAIAADVLQLSSEGMSAAASFDVSKLTLIAEQIKAKTPVAQAARSAYDSAKAECEGVAA